ncbi:O-succinylhomoserine sulfhydrylase [Pyruvatibacter mobilis]|uniref:O-succinylhomoserine sulfhydrylase n=1 Tax=Pyruvatibacter mobilis TaxID=1712261 RepID=A0A845Q8K6_9HYPH|nr:O-succinylhomoserine sulfhydrylase [Pyruvatibacter mobilis]NBG94784.1 O-succinylhomoserine sulfhydrylase [Pyruvatibacter mobilis]QJD75976.1 O-succinylhomoserine sulfhydrylase [Pyruvatibacter mobilis]GGD20077.1 O-succinylhomoserine sulfhydrylase [Pyruvatibacter mobilis]
MGKSSTTTSSDRKLRPQTEMVHGGTLRTPFGETSEAMFLTSGYVYETAEQAEARFKGEDDGFVYSRFANPTVRMFEERMIALEGAEAARATATGMAAVTAAMLCQLSAGDHVVAARALFGSCRYIVEDLLPRFGIESTLVDGCDLDQWRAARKPNTKVFFLETPTNPTLDVIDLRAVAEIAHEAGARLVVDNVFATPVLQKPLEFGADVVVYSATKHIDGQGRCLGGVVLGSDQFVTDHLANFLRQTGPALSPFNAWVMLKSLETLDLRVRRHCENAIAVADFLGSQEKIARVIYPGRADHPQHNLAKAQMDMPGNMIAFEVQGGKEAAFRLANRLEVIKISNNLGDAKSLITHPATTTHQRLTPEARAELGISDAMLRLSVGLEDAADLTEDLGLALDAA